MNISFGREVCSKFDEALNKEWLIANGIGGFASSTIGAINTRRYHGLLIASFNPPVERIMMLSNLDEEVLYDGETYTIDKMCSGIYQQQFSLYPTPKFVYIIKDLRIEKIVFMIHNENTTVILYRIFNPYNRYFEIKVFPFTNYRDFHGETHKNKYFIGQTDLIRKGIIKFTAYKDAYPLYFISDIENFSIKPSWYEGVLYREETARGLPDTEDIFNPGYYQISSDSNLDFFIMATSEEERIKSKEKRVSISDVFSLYKAEEKRQMKLIKDANLSQKSCKEFFDFSSCHSWINSLVLSADSFIVKRASTGEKSIIAGYHWFSDWGRDTMISLTGLTLITKRFKDAKSIISSFIRYCKDGLLPNCFPDVGTEPAYNTIDASLWFFYAIWKYLEYTKDYKFVYKDVYPIMEQIIENHIKGTHFNIKVDEDGLLYGGSEGVQLTWMDAKVDDWVVTPRKGKCVEINALWYNALKVMEYLQNEITKHQVSNTKHHTAKFVEYSKLAQKVKNSFCEKFWNEKDECLYDYIDGDKKDSSIRPNQIYAVSLPFIMLNKEQSKKVVEKVHRELLTSYGLRSLDVCNPSYIGIYEGDRYKRDGAYHQGTVWAFLIGGFITAYIKVNNNSKKSKMEALKFIEPFRDHLFSAGLGTISEIFDGDEPFNPKGCISQAWSVAEILRVYVEDICGKH